MRPEPDPEARRIGDNVRRARRARGLSLEVVAGLAGRSGAWLSMIERGLRSLERRSDIAALAAALDVSPTDLLTVDVPYGIGGEPDGVPQLRQVLYETFDDPADVAARPLSVLTDIADGPLITYRDSADYASMVRAIPPVLAELHVHAASGDERNRVRALQLIVIICTWATSSARHLGAVDLAWNAAVRASEAAVLLDDPVYAGAAWFARAHAQPAGLGPALRRSGAAAERLQPHLGEEVFGHHVYAMLHLSAALAAQVVGCGDRAQEHLAEAEGIANRIGEQRAWQTFGPSSVGRWRVMIDVEAGRPSEALAVVPTIDRTPLTNGQRAALDIETARAYSMLGRGHESEAVMHLRDAERWATDRLHHDPMARELVADMLDHAHRTAGGRELRGLAHRMKIAS